MTSDPIIRSLLIMLAAMTAGITFTACDKSSTADEQKEEEQQAAVNDLCERLDEDSFESELRGYSGDLWVARKNTSNLTHNSVINDEVLQRIAGLEGVKAAERRYLAELTLKTRNGVTSHQVYGEDPAFFQRAGKWVVDGGIPDDGTLEADQLIIGQGFAEFGKLEVGDSVQVLGRPSIDDESELVKSIKPATLKVAAIVAWPAAGLNGLTPELIATRRDTLQDVVNTTRGEPEMTPMGADYPQRDPGLRLVVVTLETTDKDQRRLVASGIDGMDKDHVITDVWTLMEREVTKAEKQCAK